MKEADPSEYQLRFTRELGDCLTRMASEATLSGSPLTFVFGGDGVCVTTHPEEGWTQMDGVVHRLRPHPWSPPVVSHRVVVAVPYGWNARRACRPLWETACRALAVDPPI